jgi:hypothetical protein
MCRYAARDIGAKRTGDEALELAGVPERLNFAATPK